MNKSKIRGGRQAAIFAVFGGRRLPTAMKIAGKSAAALARIGADKAAAALIRRLISGAAGVCYLEGKWLEKIPAAKRHTGGMPAAALTKTQAGSGGRILLLKPEGVKKQKENHPEITDPSDYLLIAEITKSPDGAITEPSTAAESRARRRLYKRIGGKNWILVWDLQKDGRNVVVSFHAITDRQVEKKFKQEK